MFHFLTRLSVSLLSISAAGAAAQSDVQQPYWASIDQAEARMRTGPSTEFPVKWLYRRKNLPVKVLMKHSVWRKVEDPDGDQGWMHVRLLSPVRTAMIVGDIAEMLAEPRPGAQVSWRAEPGVVGRISDCAGGWCLFDVAGQRGYVRTTAIWGDEAPNGARE